MGNGLWHHMTMYHIAPGQFLLPIPIVQAFTYTKLCINSAISFKGETSGQGNWSLNVCRFQVVSCSWPAILFWHHLHKYIFHRYRARTKWRAGSTRLGFKGGGGGGGGGQLNKENFHTPCPLTLIRHQLQLGQCAPVESLHSCSIIQYTPHKHNCTHTCTVSVQLKTKYTLYVHIDALRNTMLLNIMYCVYCEYATDEPFDVRCLNISKTRH